MSENIEYLKQINGSKTAIIMIHGYGASMNDLFGISSLDEKKQYDWFFPNGPFKVDLGFHMTGHAWFPLTMSQLEAFNSENPASVDMAYDDFRAIKPVFINQFNELLKGYDSVIVSGFSQGAMMSSHVFGLLDNVKGLALFSGALLDEEQLAESLKKVKPGFKFYQSHGKSDPVLPFSQGMKLYEFLKLSKLQGEFTSFEGQHEIPMNVINNFFDYLELISDK